MDKNELTEHLERLPDWLFVENMVSWVRVTAVLYALHILVGFKRAGITMT
jgi:hypothetical protein